MKAKKLLTFLLAILMLFGCMSIAVAAEAEKKLIYTVSADSIAPGYAGSTKVAVITGVSGFIVTGGSITVAVAADVVKEATAEATAETALTARQEQETVNAIGDVYVETTATTPSGFYYVRLHATTGEGGSFQECYTYVPFVVGTTLDNEEGNTIPASKSDIEQNYVVSKVGNYTDKSKVVVFWSIPDISVTVTENKVWNTETLKWDVVDTDTSSTHGNGAGGAEFTFYNYSSLKVKASVRFTAEDAYKNSVGKTDKYTEKYYVDGISSVNATTVIRSAVEVRSNPEAVWDFAPSKKISYKIEPADGILSNIPLNTESKGQFGTYTVTVSDKAFIEPNLINALAYDNTNPTEMKLDSQATLKFKALEGNKLLDTITKASDMNLQGAEFVSYTIDDNGIATLVIKNPSDDVTFDIIGTGYLTFTSNQDGSYVTPDFERGDSLRYRIYDSSQGTWGEWTERTPIVDNRQAISLDNGDRLQLSGINCMTSLITSGYFKMGGSIAASGDVTSVLNGIGGGIALPDGYNDRAGLSAGCFNAMFCGCAALTSAPNLPSTTLGNNCYNYMFAGCSSLETAPALPATTLADACYSGLFSGCSSLKTVPELPVTTLAGGCYYSMFSGCSSLKTAPALPATTLAGGCYGEMFRGCSSLKTAPALPATTLAGSCYSGMFYGCSSLETAPALPATTLPENCYAYMFSGCSSLKTAPALPATTLAYECYAYMFSGCSSLTTAPALPVTTLAPRCYYSMFSECSSLETAPALPATTLANSCYDSMFSKCSSLETAPALPATTLTVDCYRSMFSECSSLETAPALPATTLTENCYKEMFSGCSSLETAPAISATTLADKCCYAMFSNCTNLKTAPVLSATTLAEHCYGEMFYGCSSLETAPALPATTLAGSCYGEMFYGCSSLETAPTLPATTLAENCYDNMFEVCKNLFVCEDSVPEGASASGAFLVYNATTDFKKIFGGTGGTYTAAPTAGHTYYWCQFTVNAPTTTNCHVDGTAPTQMGGEKTIKFVAETGYELPDSVTVTGATYVWDQSTGVLKLSKPTGTVSITVVATAE